MNPLLEKLPKHLLQYTVAQDYSSYTAQNHAVWRYVMRMNTYFLKKRAHKSYLKGLEQTGISVEYIPSLKEMLNGVIDLEPKFQRRERWNKKQQSKLIESIIMAVPIPPIFLAEEEYNQYSVMDGKQRLEESL